MEGVSPMIKSAYLMITKECFSQKNPSLAPKFLQPETILLRETRRRPTNGNVKAMPLCGYVLDS